MQLNKQFTLHEEHSEKLCTLPYLLKLSFEYSGLRMKEANYQPVF